VIQYGAPKSDCAVSTPTTDLTEAIEFVRFSHAPSIREWSATRQPFVKGGQKGLMNGNNFDSGGDFSACSLGNPSVHSLSVTLGNHAFYDLQTYNWPCPTGICRYVRCPP